MDSSSENSNGSKKEQEPTTPKQEKDDNEAIYLVNDQDVPKFDLIKFYHEFNPLFNFLKSTLRELKFFKDILDSDPNEKILRKVHKQFQLLRRTAISDMGAVYFPKNKEYVYVLLLEEKKYYVGYSEQLETRLLSHFQNDGSVWTKKYKPIEVLEISRGGKDIEEQKTLEMMRKHGWQNVRGSYWCQINLKFPPKNL